jgi:hypothetical protein
MRLHIFRKHLHSQLRQFLNRRSVVFAFNLKLRKDGRPSVEFLNEICHLGDILEASVEASTIEGEDGMSCVSKEAD